ncbi:MAG: thioredoxin domain-containing protein [Nitrospirota bacterium]
MIAPVLEKIARERAGLLKIVRVNLDDEPALGARFGIRATPTLMLYRNGEKLNEFIGALSEKELAEWIDSSAGD